MSGHYVISKRSDGWVVAVDGAMLLVCERKKMAIRAVRDAARHVDPAPQTNPDCEAPERMQSEGRAEPLIAMAS
jgi:hypothetical protein